MQAALGITLGVLVGGFLGYMAGMYVACEGSPVQLFDGGNLCGLFGVFITGPIDSIAGGAAGWFVSRRRPSTP